MNKVTTDFAMGIADKDLSEELQVRSEQPREVECKCLASCPLSRCPLRADWSLENRGRNSPRSGAGREARLGRGVVGSCGNGEGHQLSQWPEQDQDGERWELRGGGRRKPGRASVLPCLAEGTGYAGGAEIRWRK